MSGTTEAAASGHRRRARSDGRPPHAELGAVQLRRRMSYTIGKLARD
jgi:hypothetical protein